MVASKSNWTRVYLMIVDNVYVNPWINTQIDSETTRFVVWFSLFGSLARDDALDDAPVMSRSWRPTTINSSSQGSSAVNAMRFCWFGMNETHTSTPQWLANDFQTRRNWPAAQSLERDEFENNTFLLVDERKWVWRFSQNKRHSRNRFAKCNKFAFPVRSRMNETCRSSHFARILIKITLHSTAAIWQMNESKRYWFCDERAKSSTDGKKST